MKRKPLPRKSSSAVRRPDTRPLFSRLKSKVFPEKREPQRRMGSIDRQTIESKRQGRGSKVREGTIRSQRYKARTTITPRQRAVAASSIAIVAGSSALFALGVRELHQYLRTSSDFALSNIEIRGLERSREFEVRDLAGLEEGMNIFSVDADEVAARVSSHPWIKSVDVKRTLPHDVSIDVNEHVAVALAAVGHLYYVDAEGELVKRRTNADVDSLPILTGLNAEKLEAGDAVEKARLQTGISFVQEAARIFGAGASPLSEVFIDEMKRVTFSLANDPTRVVVGAAPWDDRLLRVARVREELAARGLVATEVSLGGGRRQDRVVAKLVRAEVPAKGSKRSGNGVGAKGPTVAQSVAGTPRRVEDSTLVSVGGTGGH